MKVTMLDSRSSKHYEWKVLGRRKGNGGGKCNGA